MSQPPLSVLYEDNHLLVVNKPPGVASQGALPDAPSLVHLAKDYLKGKYNKPGDAYVGVVSRLDQPVSGVVVLAKTSKAAQRLNDQFRGRAAQKTYWALVETPADQSPLSDVFECVDWLKPAVGRKGSQLAREGDPDAQDARLRGRVLNRGKGIALLEIDLQTGRKHQIRVQLAARGWPILGDRLYGARKTFPNGIALHARTLTIVHPTTREEMEFVAPPGVAWRAYLGQIGAS